MKPDDLDRDEILDCLLAKVGEVRRRRRTVKVATATAVLVLLAWMAFDRPAQAPRHRGPSVVWQETQTPSDAGTLAVVVWRNGVPRLEEMGGDQLADLELDFSLEPVAAYMHEDGWLPSWR